MLSLTCRRLVLALLTAILAIRAAPTDGEYQGFSKCVCIPEALLVSSVGSFILRHPSSRFASRCNPSAAIVLRSSSSRPKCLDGREQRCDLAFVLRTGQE